MNGCSLHCCVQRKQLGCHLMQSLLVGLSGLVSRFRRKPQPRHRRKNRVPGKTQQKLAGESLLADAGSGGSDWWGKLRV